MKKGFKIFLLVAAIIMVIAVLGLFAAITIMGDRHETEHEKGKAYFDFDEVVYYKTIKDFDDLIDVDGKKVRTRKDSVTEQIISDFEEVVPYDVAAAYLDSIGFEKQVLLVSKHSELMEIFSEKSNLNIGSTTCEPIYRDVYVFKKNGKFSGMAKLCYECGLSHFIGTNADTDNFGSEGEYTKLKALVN
ncbi:MAG: hypothetical protein DI539_13780 [Flavobacterium psychrophilum]|nr:MAG: hypothetical protein DI539_13780 [Flavobacterium psychrophilum]